MYSTDHHINNPTGIDRIDVGRELNMEKHPVVEYVTQDYYDRIGNPDPYTVYHITDSEEEKMYLGRNLIRSNGRPYRYMMAPGEMKDEWDVVEVDGDGNFNVLGTCDFVGAGNMIRDLIDSGIPGSLNNRLYSAVENYVRRRISLDEAIVGCLVAFGIPMNDPELQRLLSWVSGEASRRKMSRNERNLELIANQNPGGIASLYRKVYNWFLVNDFFISMERMKDDEVLPIGEELQRLHKEYIEWRLVG